MTLWIRVFVLPWCLNHLIDVDQCLVELRNSQTQIFLPFSVMLCDITGTQHSCFQNGSQIYSNNKKTGSFLKNSEYGGQRRTNSGTENWPSAPRGGPFKASLANMLISTSVVQLSCSSSNTAEKLLPSSNRLMLLFLFFCNIFMKPLSKKGKVNINLLKCFLTLL